MKMPKKIKIKPLIFLILLTCVFVSGFTIAFMSNTSEFFNNFITSDYDVSIEEEFYGDWGTKKVKFVNNDDSPVVLRVNYNEIWSSKYGESSLLLTNKLKGRDVVIKAWTAEWKDDFSESSDGWYYYNKILNANDSVQVLNSISLYEDLLKKSSMYDQYLGSDYALIFNYEVAQADQKAIKKLWGHDVTINGNDLIWSFN